MMSIFFKTLLAFGLLFTVGCGSAYYKPTSMNIPNFKEKNELFLALNVNTTAGGDVQAAYAITDHLAVQASYMKGSDVVGAGGFLTPSYDITRKIAFGEFAIGYFSPKNNFKTFSIFGGYGAGDISNETSKSGRMMANFSKMFLQASLGFKEKNVEFVSSAKLAMLNYTNLKHNYIYASDADKFNVLKNTIPLAELGSILRVGNEKIKFQCQIATSLELDSRPLFEYDFLSLGAGVCVQLNAKKKPKQ